MEDKIEQLRKNSSCGIRREKKEGVFKKDN